MKPSFLNHDKPLITAMILCETPEECIAKIKASIEDGADAIGIQLCKLKLEYRTREILTEIFAACEGKPIYVTSYHENHSIDFTDEQCVEYLLLALDCGATLCDVEGDLYDRKQKFQLTTDKEAIKKQKALIDEIHRRGGEVLMSCHTNMSITLEESLMIAREQAARGADVLKIVSVAHEKSEIPKYIDAIQKICAVTDKKLLYLVSGEGQIIRYLGPSFGVCMYLALHKQGKLDNKWQPLIKNIKPIRDNMNFSI
ncbi:MAG: type I 3-dehydroquinate dehydratase [Clostridia bacterium]|nr:type I 3-dehydroquinate dehydratase [Clostridia bacterium]